MEQETASGTAEKIGEVIEASTTGFVAQAYVLHEAPAFGSFVHAGDGEIEVIGVVANARTGSVDPGRRPVARGQDEEDEEEIYRHNPELREILRTEFAAVVVGYRDSDGSFVQRLPRRPPRLHAFVHACPTEDVAAFSDNLDFLPSLLSGSGKVPADELVAACLREASTARGGDRAFLVRAGKELANLLANDLNRLSAVLRRMR